MLGTPSEPRQVSAVADRDAGGQARVSWLPPTYDGGSTVAGYTIRHTGGSSGSTECTASPCTITGLTNGKDYTFTVTARNGVGDGTPSAPSNTVRPDTLPRQVTGVRMVDRGDGTLNIAWDVPENEGSPIEKYVVRVVSAAGDTKTQDVPAASTTATVGGLDNESEQSVQVQAWNELGAGPFGPAVTMQSAGTPPALPAPAIAASGPGPAQDSATLTISWDQGRPNGPPTIRYTLYRSIDGGAWTEVARTSPDVRTARDVIPYDGRTYRYSATVTNGADLEGPTANASSFTSVGQPSTPSLATATPDPDGRIELTVGVGQPRAGAFTAIRWSGRRQGRHPRVRLHPGHPGRLHDRRLRHQPHDVARHHRVDRQLRRQRVRPRLAQRHPVPRHPDPHRLRRLAQRHDGAVVVWNLPENGRPIDQVQVDGDGGGHLRWQQDPAPVNGSARWQLPDPGARPLGCRLVGVDRLPARSTSPTPRPRSSTSTRVRPTVRRTPWGPARSGGCPRVNFDVRNFPAGGGGWSVTVRRGGSNAELFTSSRPVLPERRRQRHHR